jgi:hypothetical protein
MVGKIGAQMQGVWNRQADDENQPNSVKPARGRNLQVRFLRNSKMSKRTPEECFEYNVRLGGAGL